MQNPDYNWPFYLSNSSYRWALKDDSTSYGPMYKRLAKGDLTLFMFGDNLPHAETHDNYTSFITMYSNLRNDLTGKRGD